LPNIEVAPEYSFKIITGWAIKRLQGITRKEQPVEYHRNRIKPFYGVYEKGFLSVFKPLSKAKNCFDKLAKFQRNRES